MVDKKRLDVLVYEKGLAPSREMAQRYILAGQITVNRELHTKPGMRVSEDVEIILKEVAQFVGRGGLKLEHALQSFNIAVQGLVCADVGASTGGFTDCLLQQGATKIYAIDVGYGQLALKLRNDPRVVVMERTNARHIEKLDDPINLVVIDVSFISIRLLLPTIRGWLSPNATIIALIKPQFEAGKAEVGKGGIVKDIDIHRRVLHHVLTDAQTMGYAVCGLTCSPITGTKGNIEFLAWLSLSTQTESPDLESLIAEVLG